MHLFFVSSRLHWRERGLFTTPALTSTKGLTLLCSSVLMLWVSHFFLSFCLPLSLALITFACLEDSCPGWNLSWPCKLAAQLFPSKPTILPHRSIDSKFVCSTKSSRMFASVLILASPSERATGCWLTGTSPALWQHKLRPWLARMPVCPFPLHSFIYPTTYTVALVKRHVCMSNASQLRHWASTLFLFLALSWKVFGPGRFIAL